MQIKFENIVSKKILFFYPLLFVAIGSMWAIISPVSSSADDDFHLTSIWCAQGPSENCIHLVDGTVKVPSELNTNLIPPKYSSWPPCYVDWFLPTKSAKCLNLKEKQFSLTDRVGSDYYPDFYYLFHSFFVSDNVIFSVYLIRIINVFIGALILTLLMYVSENFIRRAVILSWGITAFPISIFFISSNNPSSWSIIGIGTFWGFLLNLFDQYFKKLPINSFNLIGLLFSVFLSVGSRNDSIIYICIIFFSICLMYTKEILNLKLKNKLFLSFFIFFGSILGVNKVLKEISGFNLSFPVENTELNRPNSVINLLIEFPSFIFSFVGGQQPFWIQNRGNLGRDYSYGAGWLEFSYPSITGIFLNLVVWYFVLNGLAAKYKLKNYAFVLGFICVILIVVISRAKWGFLEGDYFQPRYLVPIIIFLTGIALVNFEHRHLLKSNFQLIIIIFLFTIGSSIAWLATLSRYINDGNVPFTNFKVSYDWWILPDSFSKFDIFILYLIIQSLWTFFYVVVPIKHNFYQVIFEYTRKEPIKPVKN